MGGVPLPTASTPGYGYYPVVTTWAPDVACDCLRAWIPAFIRLCELKGYGTPAVWQCTGGDANSAGTHTQGGAVDFGGLGNARAMLAREMGAWATWPRNWTGNQHTHGVLAGCPHNYPARYQLDAMRAGYDGLGVNGRAGPDPLRGSPTTYRTWSQGLAWAKAEIDRLEDPLSALNDYQTKRLNAAVDRILGAVPAGAYLTRKDRDGHTPRILDSGDGGYLVGLITDTNRDVAALAKAVADLKTAVDALTPKA